MVKAPKHRRIKRATVLIKRAHCIRSTKTKSYSPLYQKLKVNNHSLARALSQEKQESQLLFSRNVELLAEVQDLIHACNNRDLVISNVLKNAKDMMQMLVTMSGFLSNTISSCQEFVANQVNIHRTSTSSTGRRESSRRLSTKSPARGVVKPMVSGHTITKPTINLSRVNMQRLQNVNLSIIEEGPSTPERDLDRSVSNRGSRTLPERLPVSSLRNEDTEDRVIVNRRTNRFSGGRLSSGRYSKRNSGRLSGGGVAGRLSKRSSEYSELLKSPRVTLQDVSRYLTNNQTINIRMLSDTANSSRSSNTSVDDTQMIEAPSSPEDLTHVAVIPESQDSGETSESERDINSTLTTTRKSSATSVSKRISRKKPKSQSPVIESQDIDPLEGSSWMHNSSTEDEQQLNTGVLENGEESTEPENEQPNTPVSTFAAERRRNSTYFRMPELPKVSGKPNVSRITFKDDFETRNGSNGLDDSNGFLDNDDDEDDHRVNLRYITKRRGPSTKAPSMHSMDSGVNNNDVDEEDEDETLMLNIRRQIGQSSSGQQPPEQPERLQFDVNELLQLTPLKPLLSMNGRINNGVAQADVESEPTATIQITQRLPKPVENTDNFSRMSNMKMQQNAPPDLPALTIDKNQEPGISAQDKRISELAARPSSRIELPRLTDILNSSDDNYQQMQTITNAPETNNKQLEKRKRMVVKSVATPNASDDNQDEVPVQKKKPRQRKKKLKDKDPSTAKVVLQKLNDVNRGFSQGDTGRSDRKNSDESVCSTRSSLLSRPDHSSDSESSTASVSSKQIITRPRRLKAPKNLQEPNLTKKLRR